VLLARYFEIISLVQAWAKKANECKRIVGVSVLMAGVSTEGAAEFNNKKVVYLIVDNATYYWLGWRLLSTQHSSKKQEEQEV